MHQVCVKVWLGDLVLQFMLVRGTSFLQCCAARIIATLKARKFFAAVDHVKNGSNVLL